MLNKSDLGQLVNYYFTKSNTHSYVKILHKKLLDASDNFIDSEYDCRKVALAIAENLSLDGYTPKLYFLRSYIYKSDEGLDFDKLHPKIKKYENWIYHYVVGVDDLIYDPLLKYPIKKNKYSKKLFGKEISLREQNLKYNNNDKK